MSFLDRLRNAFSGPARIDDTVDDPSEADASLQEEYGSPDTSESEMQQLAETGGGGGGAFGTDRYAASESAEVAEADLESEETPTDPAP